MPDGGLVVFGVIQLEEDSVWVDDLFSAEPCWKYLFFQHVFVRVSDRLSQEYGGNKGVDQTYNSRGDEESALPGQFGLNKMT